MQNDVERAVNTIAAIADPQEKKEAVDAVASMWPTGDRSKTMIWMTVLIGLIVIGLMALMSSAWLLHDGKDATAIVAVASAVVAGVFGLFAKSPAA